MLAIEVEYLLGRAVATDVSERDLVEWPPHPSRLFSALVDALGDVGNDLPEQKSDCESALRWLEALPPPEIAASVADDVSIRTTVKYWVPINDEVADKVRSAPLVEQRKRQERFFPAAVPSHPVVVFTWPTVETPTGTARALDILMQRVPYLGHSSSLVRLFRSSEAPASTLVPRSTGAHRLRVPGPGRLDRLNATFEQRKTDTAVQAPIGREVLYDWARQDRPRGPHGIARVIAFEGPPMGVENAAFLTARYREALLSLLGDDAPSVLTGHAARGEPATNPHIAFVPLANVNHEFADGSIKGIGVVLPRDIHHDHLLRLDAAIRRLRSLHFGAQGAIGLRLSRGAEGLKSLDFGRYCRASSVWASVTPVALSQYPKSKKGLSEEAVVARDFSYLGLPEPVEIYVQDVAFVRGAPRAREFARGRISSVTNRLLRHVYVRFAEKVEGPLLVGAGRHMGFGVLSPRWES